MDMECDCGLFLIKCLLRNETDLFAWEVYLMCLILLTVKCVVFVKYFCFCVSMWFSYLPWMMWTGDWIISVSCFFSYSFLLTLFLFLFSFFTWLLSAFLPVFLSFFLLSYWCTIFLFSSFFHCHRLLSASKEFCWIETARRMFDVHEYLKSHVQNKQHFYTNLKKVAGVRGMGEICSFGLLSCTTVLIWVFIIWMIFLGEKLY